MMWSTIANYKENLNQIVLDVKDAAQELEIYRPSTGEDSSVSDRRTSHRFAQSKSPLRSPIANGIDSGFKGEIEQYKAEIKKLQASEAEIKALSINYAALLKEKEEQLSRLQDENGSLKQTLESTNSVWHPSRNESVKMLPNNTNVLKGVGDQSPNKQQKPSAQANNRSTGNQMQRGIVLKQDTLSNGSIRVIDSDSIQNKMEFQHENVQGNYKELADLLEEKNRSLAAMQANHKSEIERLKMELDKERGNLARIQLQLQEEHKMSESFLKELQTLKLDKERSSTEMKQLCDELNEKISEIRRLQLELRRRDEEEAAADDSVEGLKKTITTLEKENATLKVEKGELEAALRMSGRSSPDDISTDGSSKRHLEVSSSGGFPSKGEIEMSVEKLEKDLNETRRERDKALQELTRLKQHLLEKELEESDKMDEDSKIIEELRANTEYQRAQILHLEKALKQAIVGQEEVKKINSNELQKSTEIINDLKQKLANCMGTIDAKNVELLNLQTALGQYYAESEAKERLERDLALSREELAKLHESLKDANERVELSKREKEEILSKLSQAERMLSEGKYTVQKLEEDNTKLRRALEQSMTRLNRMSMDSDYFVDRRIVIKLLVTYFQRNHSKEVLDLMVRMLGFSEEDKQRIGVAQQGAGKGVVRGVLGLPGRLVGGILGGSSPEVPGHVPSENQSFTDLWVDFLLKETERRESVEATGGSKADPHGRSPSTTHVITPMPNQRSSTSSSASRPLRVHQSLDQTPDPISSRGNPLLIEHSDSEFSTVPLTTSISPSPENGSRISRLLPRY
ncbi:PREDICTED: golgin candidate 4 [Nelumbo nucifera]|uniref:Golgin candidate 4 n=2 Tax=Nelumbo nucifera TaxID=4432 RepID=A0A822XFT5_NELNU|nr:PREDICTED: golgin candidate 4 [Nelumbo nucifera]DAD19077.1 TPA_asm: hypothetical protein HUJ06_020540 [Nelumbo nucifera]